ncbi:MAG: dethiobiotin synthase [Holophagales bacterium]|nr:dethiobiotin synthase [Holophagales bacterium]
MPSPLWILGTDTDIGKTHIASHIARSWAKDTSVVYRKPFQTGVDSDTDVNADAIKVAGPNITVETGLALKAALSPLAAAESEGIQIDLEKIFDWCKRPVPQGARLILEPAGGVMVPLADGTPFAKWASALGIPGIVVARGSLGTLNHVLLTCEALMAHGWKIAAVVLNPGLDNSFEAAKDNAKILERFLNVPIQIHESDRKP